MVDIMRKQAAEMLGVSLTAIRQWIQKGHLVEGKSIGRAKTITKESIDNLLKDERFIKGVAIAQGTKLVKKENSELDELCAEIKYQIEKGFSSLREELLKEIEEIKKALGVLSIKQIVAKTPQEYEDKNWREMLSGSIPDKGKTTKQIRSKTKVTKSVKKVNKLTKEEAKKYIQETIEKYEVSVKKICPAGKGAALGKWLKKGTNAKEENIAKWLKTAQQLRKGK